MCSPPAWTARDQRPVYGHRIRSCLPAPGPGSGQEPGLIPIDGGTHPAAALNHEHGNRRHGIHHHDRPARSPPAAPLRRNKMVAGVAGGIARYLDTDVTLVRVIIAALVLLNGAGLALYIAAWLLIPEDGHDQSLAATWIADRQNRRR
jgi:phage shock protein PspC (stress-responsive transcriptional regulator)